MFCLKLDSQVTILSSKLLPETRRLKDHLATVEARGCVHFRCYFDLRKKFVFVLNTIVFCEKKCSEVLLKVCTSQKVRKNERFTLEKGQKHVFKFSLEAAVVSCRKKVNKSNPDRSLFDFLKGKSRASSPISTIERWFESRVFTRCLKCEEPLALITHHTQYTLTMGDFWSPGLTNGIGPDRTGPNNGPVRTEQLFR